MHTWLGSSGGEFNSEKGATPLPTIDYFQGGSISDRLETYSSFLNESKLLKYINKLETKEIVENQNSAYKNNLVSMLSPSHSVLSSDTQKFFENNPNSPTLIISPTVKEVEKRDSDNDSEEEEKKAVNSAAKQTLELAEIQHNEEKNKSRSKKLYILFYIF